ncbi:hypothetical protein CFK41_13895 [Brachybacterium ginsengisoli]|uniref:Uncharacterized protein n=1 Tax=Brachybacterium ginsengisoli TaxID=1331682 RepID=A0A291H068_9MICO|nr:hypothetical protein CFK41_13895 [Brachybacterium ginsengisoli]
MSTGEPARRVIAYGIRARHRLTGSMRSRSSSSQATAATRERAGSSPISPSSRAAPWRRAPASRTAAASSPWMR